MIALNIVFFLTGEKLFDILGMLNSKLILFYFKNCLGTTSGVGTNRWLKYTVEQLPLVNKIPEMFSELVKKRISLKNEYEEIKAEINRKVYDFYDLNEEEIAFIEGK